MGGEVCTGLASEHPGMFHSGLWPGGLPEREREMEKARASSIHRRRTDASELRELRRRLHALQRRSGKAMLYANIGLDPRCSDAEIFGSLKRFRAANAAGERLSPEVRYAMEVLGTPVTREQYDRKLFSMLSDALPDHASRSTDSMEQLVPEPRSWFHPGFMLVGVALLLPVDHDQGLLGLHQLKKVTSVFERMVNSHAATIDYAAEIEKRDLKIRELTEARQHEQMQLRQAKMEAQQWQADKDHRLQMDAQAIRDSRRKEEDRQRIESRNRNVAQELHQREVSDARARGNIGEVERLLNRGPGYY